MGRVVTILKIMPEGDVNFENLKEVIKNLSYVQNIKEKPIAFGIIAIEATALIDDKEGGTDSIENEISSINGVQSVEVTDIELL